MKIGARTEIYHMVRTSFRRHSSCSLSETNSDGIQESRAWKEELQAVLQRIEAEMKGM
jgi:hypothetical protein